MAPAKTSLKSELALLQTLFRKFFWIWICMEVQENKKSRSLVFTSSTKREIGHFHVVIVQWRPKKKTKINRHKSVMYEQSCCFIASLPFRLPSPSSLLKLPTIFWFILATQARNNFFCFLRFSPYAKWSRERLKYITMTMQDLEWFYLCASLKWFVSWLFWIQMSAHFKTMLRNEES